MRVLVAGAENAIQLARTLKSQHYTYDVTVRDIYMQAKVAVYNTLRP